MTALKFYNTKSRAGDEFKSIIAGEVSLYTCGPTVYNSLHIGNWLAYIRWDVLVRTLSLNGYKINRVMNITDVGHLVGDGDEGQDKLEAGAKREGLNAWQVAERYTNEFMIGMDKLKLLPPTKYAKATDYIEEQIKLVQALEDKGYTYKTNDGLYFDTSKFKNYAEFARLNLSSQEAGARVEVNPEKHQPWDFAVWKLTPEGVKRDMEWDSPWGKGFPGWHLECSAIAITLLSETIDIHTGGIDHIPVHHTNEIAQSESATNKVFANYWLHNNFLLIDSSKISKSLENGFTLDDLEKNGYSALDFKMMALQSHYRSEANFSWEVLGSSKKRLKELGSFAVLRFQPNPNALQLDSDYFEKSAEAIKKHLNEDMSTPSVMAEISSVVKKILDECYGIRNDAGLKELEKYVEFLDKALGFELLTIPDINKQQKELLDKRQEARKQQNWTEADKLRDQLDAENIEVNDLPTGFQIWNWK